MWWNGMMPPAEKTALWTGSKWLLETISPLFSQVCQPVFKRYMDSFLQIVTVLCAFILFHTLHPQCNIWAFCIMYKIR